jgi:hypothetical protein
MKRSHWNVSGVVQMGEFLSHNNAMPGAVPGIAVLVPVYGYSGLRILFAQSSSSPDCILFTWNIEIVEQTTNIQLTHFLR